MALGLLSLLGAFFVHAPTAAVTHAAMVAAPHIPAGIAAGSGTTTAVSATATALGANEIRKGYNKEQKKVHKAQAQGKKRTFDKAVKETIG